MTLIDRIKTAIQVARVKRRVAGPTPREREFIISCDDGVRSVLLDGDESQTC